MRIGAVITARSTSSRYPRKHLGILGGKPMIVQIIEKLNRLSNLDEVILSTTLKSTDDELVRLSLATGAKVTRGEEYDLLERDFQTINDHNLDAVLKISGDCPFVSNELAQALIDGLRAEPNPENFDQVGCSVGHPMASGFEATIMLRSGFEKYERMMLMYPGYSYEQYWVVGKEEPKAIKTLAIDTSHILVPSITPMKLSIDWNLERLFFNEIIDWLGYYPEKIEDFNKAYGGMDTLCESK